MGNGDSCCGIGERPSIKAMKIPAAHADWPQSWKLSQQYDLIEMGSGPIPRKALGHRLVYRLRLARMLRLLEEVLPPPARVLDLAAAQGNLTLALAEKGYDVTWNDLRAELAGYVRLKQEGGKVSYESGNILERSSDQQPPFDAVVAGEVIEHVAHPDQFLAALATFLRPGGVLILSTPNGGYFRNRLPRFSDVADPSVFEALQFQPDGDGHIFLLHEDEIRRLARAAGLVVERLDLFANPLTHGHMKLSYLQAVLPLGVVRGLEAISCGLPAALRRKLHTACVVRLRKVA